MLAPSNGEGPVDGVEVDQAVGGPEPTSYGIGERRSVRDLFARPPGANQCISSLLEHLDGNAPRLRLDTASCAPLLSAESNERAPALAIRLVLHWIAGGSSTQYGRHLGLQAGVGASRHHPVLIHREETTVQGGIRMNP